MIKRRNVFAGVKKDQYERFIRACEDDMRKWKSEKDNPIRSPEQDENEAVRARIGNAMTDK